MKESAVKDSQALQGAERFAGWRRLLCRLPGSEAIAH
jgi:hypothetical protein